MAYIDQLKELMAKHKDERKACSAFVKTLPDEEKERLEKLVEETRFLRRRYGETDYFCWPIHSVFKERPVSPWPAIRYPRVVLMADFAIRT